MDITLRRLKSSDMFPMFTILSKIGFKELKKAIDPDSISKIMNKENKDVPESEGAPNMQMMVGVSIIMDVLEVIMANLPKIENDLYKFLASVSVADVTPEEIAELDMAEFTEMIVSLLKKDEFKDFFRVVSGLFK